MDLVGRFKASVGDLRNGERLVEGLLGPDHRRVGDQREVDPVPESQCQDFLLACTLGRAPGWSIEVASVIELSEASGRVAAGLSNLPSDH